MGGGGGGHCLVRMEWRPAGWSLCLPLLIFPCTMKSRSPLLALAHPGGPGKRAVKRLWCGGGELVAQLLRCSYLSLGLHLDSVLFNLDHELLGVCRRLDQFRLKILQFLLHHRHLQQHSFPSTRTSASQSQMFRENLWEHVSLWAGWCSSVAQSTCHEQETVSAQTCQHLYFLICNNNKATHMLQFLR